MRRTRTSQPAALPAVLAIALTSASLMAPAALAETDPAAAMSESAMAQSAAEDVTILGTSSVADAAPEDVAPEDADAAPIDPMAPRQARDVTLEEFQWIARPLVVFADTPADPRFAEQLQMLAARPDVLLERDVVIIVDTDPSEQTAIRTALRPRGFSLVIVQKDGRVGLRRPSPRDVRELTRAIDNFAIRQQEMRRGQ